MARTTAELLTRFEAFVDPSSFGAHQPLQGGVAAVYATVEQFGEDAATAGLWGGADGVWLSLHARSQGTRRRSGEADETLRTRLRTVEGALTRPAILDAVNSLMSAYTDEEALIVEWWESPYLGETYIGEDHAARLSPGPSGFLVILPAGLGEAGWGDAHLGETFLGESFLGIEEADILGLLASEVVAKRAAGVRAWLVILSA